MEVVLIDKPSEQSNNQPRDIAQCFKEKLRNKRFTIEFITILCFHYRSAPLQVIRGREQNVSMGGKP